MHDQRSDQALVWRRWYSTAEWRRTRDRQLAAHPLCAMCEAAGRVTAATVCDHVDPASKATRDGFFAGPFQSLCDADPWRCHSRTKQREERIGYNAAVDYDGWPSDPRHPANRRTTTR